MKKLKFSNVNRRHLTLIGLVFLIAVAGYVNVRFSNNTLPVMSNINEETKSVKNEKNEENTSLKSDPYTLAIMERDNKRSKSMDVLREIIESQSCDKETKDNAQLMLTNSAKYINDENTIESSIKAKGIEKNVVYIDSDSVSVLVYDKKLTNVLVSQIKDIVTEKTNISPNKIKIIENK